MDLFSRLRENIVRMIDPNQQLNKFNQAFYWGLNGGGATYDPLRTSYIEYGYNINPFVYYMIRQMSTKTASVPLYIKKIENEKGFNQLNRLRKATGYDMTAQQKIQHLLLENKSFDKSDLPWPMEKPNHTQTWTEWIALFKTFIKTTGNAYLYMDTVEDGVNAGMPLSVYWLPADNMEIVLKENASMLTTESPIDYYILVESKNYIKFEHENIIHIKYNNPNYGQNGEHLYGLSDLRAALKNIESSNSGLDLNIKTLKSGGAFGFIHGKQTALTKPQAQELKDRLVEMNNSPENLGKIAGVSADMGFTRISLTSDELKPFDYLGFDEKQISNVLNWAIDDGQRGDFGGTIKELKKGRVVDNIVPDLELLVEALNHHFLPRFKGYENTVIEFDVMELPEMQDNQKELSEWLYNGLDRGTFNRNEIRKALRWIESDDKDMETFTVASDVISLEESISNDFNIGPQNTTN